MAEQKLPKLTTRVRFPSSAPILRFLLTRHQFLFAGLVYGRTGFLTFFTGLELAHAIARLGRFANTGRCRTSGFAGCLVGRIVAAFVLDALGHALHQGFGLCRRIRGQVESENQPEQGKDNHASAWHGGAPAY